MNAIELKQVKQRYGDYALKDVNICLPQGCVLGLICLLYTSPSTRDS